MPLRTADLLRRLAAGSLLLAALPAAAQAQDAQPRGEPSAVVIGIPILATAKNVDTDVGNTWSIANQIADLIAADLRSTTSFIIADVKDVRTPSYPEVTAPAYAQWRSAGVKYLLSGFVNARPDGRLTVGCYVYDVQSGREVTRQGFAVTPTEWRRAAHRCADAAYVQATGNEPLFDSRIAYVAQSGNDISLVKRIAIMDFDGANHDFLTDGQATVLTPRWSPKAHRVAYTSFAGGRPQVRVFDIAGKFDRALLAGDAVSFAPAFAPDGDTLALSMSSGGNTDIVTVAVEGGYPRRLTTSPAIDTSPSYSPDGQRIAFVSDRSGSPQLYVMDADGSNQRRVSFGGGAYGSPSWSPDGERLVFARTDGAVMRVGVMNANGSDERILTNGPADEQPKWSPDGAAILFQRLDVASRRPLLANVPAEGGEVRTVPTPQGASDPHWAVRRD